MRGAKLILASASPRRLDLLRQADIVPDMVAPADIDETILKNELPVAYARRISAAKADKVAALHPDSFVLAADTVVAVGRRILPKAESDAEAAAFLRLMSGRRHRVMTSVSLALPGGRRKNFIVTSSVKFKPLSESEIAAYVAAGDWKGKAGAYGVQGFAATFISFMSGSYTNIVGLPLYETVKALKDNGYERT